MSVDFDMACRGEQWPLSKQIRGDDVRRAGGAHREWGPPNVIARNVRVTNGALRVRKCGALVESA